MQGTGTTATSRPEEQSVVAPPTIGIDWRNPEPIGPLCLQGQALRGITAAGTPICTDLMTISDFGLTSAAINVGATDGREQPLGTIGPDVPVTPTDWCLGLDIIQPSLSDPACSDVPNAEWILGG